MIGNPKTDRITERRAATKREILDAAWAVSSAHGVAALSLREVARRVGMRAPSLYEYFDSKDAIYDAMFADGNRALLARLAAIEPTGDVVTDLRQAARTWVEFAVEDVARYQLLFQRTIPGFEPSPESYALAIEIVERGREQFAVAGFRDQHLFDLWTAVVAGLAAQQTSNEPEGDRWLLLVDEMVDMFLGHVKKRSRAKTKSKSKGTRT